jgi:hypothetical protein
MMNPRPESLAIGLGVAATVFTAACGGEVLTLGQGIPEPAFGDEGRRVRNINTPDGDEDSPTLTDDLLEIYFTSNRSDGGAAGLRDVWYATRQNRTEAFAAPLPLAAANSASDEVSPAISGDGLTLWLASDREGGLGKLDIWRITRSSRDAAWGTSQNVPALNSPEDDLPRPLAGGARLMPLASRRVDAQYRTFFALLDESGTGFEIVDSSVSLSTTGDSAMDACLSEDGLSLFFNRDVDGGGADLYFAWRPSLDAPFGDATLLSKINSSSNEGSPWLSADATRFFFSSDRRDGSGRDIYATWMAVPEFE